MPRPLIEIICCSAEDCASAEKGGADRVELVSAIEMGGLTPSSGTLKSAVLSSKLPMMAMIRPRSGGFCYTSGEFDSMERDAELLLENGARGLVFGILTNDRKVDQSRTRKLVEKSRGAESVFHRAFDATADPLEALEAIIDCGVTRVLTSGQQKTAVEGAPMIRSLVEHAAGRIEILPGGGLRSENVQAVVQATGATQVHLSAFESIADMSMSGVDIAFNGRPALEDAYRAVSVESVFAVAERLNHS